MLTISSEENVKRSSSPYDSSKHKTTLHGKAKKCCLLPIQGNLEIPGVNPYPVHILDRFKYAELKQIHILTYLTYLIHEEKPK